jgi:outer membrane receptor protein involved in Fe transport
LTDRLISRREPTTAEVPLFGANASVFDNFPGERIVGGELSMKAIVTEQWTTFANGAYKVATNRETGDVVPYISRFSASGGLSYRPLEWFAFKPNAQYFGSRGEAGAYWLLNAVADFRISENLIFSAIGNNLTDREYLYAEHVRQIVDTLPGGPGRAFYGRLVAEF